MFNKRKLLAFVVGAYAILDAVQTADWIGNYPPKAWEAFMAVAKDFLLLTAAGILYSLSKTKPNVNVHIINQAPRNVTTEKTEIREKKAEQKYYQSLPDITSAPVVDVPLSRDSLNDSPCVEVPSARSASPSYRH